MPTTLLRGRYRGLRMRQGSLGGHPGGLQNASGPLLPSDALRWASDEPRMGLRWASDGSRIALDGPQMGLGWASDGQQNAQDVARMVSNGSQNTSLVSNTLSSFRRYQPQFKLFQSGGGSGSSHCNSEAHIICLESSVCQVMFNSYISKLDL